MNKVIIINMPTQHAHVPGHGARPRVLVPHLISTCDHCHCPSCPPDSMKVTLQIDIFFLIFNQSVSGKNSIDQAPSSHGSIDIAILWVRVLFIFI